MPVAAVAVASAAANAYAANKSAGATKAAGNNATAEQARQYNQTREDNMPWLDAGTLALDRQQAILDGDYTNFYASPDYLAALESGTRQLDMGATASGNLWGGGADADRIALGQNLATQNLNNYWNKLAGISNTGQQTANQLGQFGANYANQYAANQYATAGAKGSSYAANANAFGNLASQAADAWGQYRGGK